jgi:light-regulated signal transduction histidine kinase (bacteriophytochrome)
MPRPGSKANPAMSDPSNALEIDACALEPIRIPGGIQPHGALLVVDEADGRIRHASANTTAILGTAIVAGDALDRLGNTRLAADLAAWLPQSEPNFRRIATLGGRRCQVMAHRTRQGVVVEFEPDDADEPETLDTLYPRLQRFLDTLDAAPTAGDAARQAARHVRELTGFNRVLIYRFDEAWNGTVIAEDGDGTLPSYLDLRFPASDIPGQARELYRLNRLRMIPDADYTPVPIQPPVSARDGAALDLSFAALRSVSPVHLAYMRNMGTAASMSVSLVIDGRLWGLIACHHAAPWRVGPAARTACDSIGQFLAQHLGARARTEEAAQRIALKRIESGLLARLARAGSFQRALVENADSWLALFDATGAASVSPGLVLTAGRTPTQEQIAALAEWLQQQGAAPVFATDRLPALCPAAAAYADVASGVLAVSVSRLHASYILWFRPELVRTVAWAGEPRKSGHGAEQLHPRTSFARWQELLRQQAAPWRPTEIDGAAEFRAAILEYVLKRAEERAELTDELQRSNKELESFSYSVSHDLRAPFRHIVGYAQLLAERAEGLDERSRHYLTSIQEAALSAGRLVDDLLNFSQLNRARLNVQRIDTGKLVTEVRHSLLPDAQGRTVEWRVGALPEAWADPSLLRQALLNLLSNALKYSRGRDPAVIEITGEDRASETVYVVRDNGIGFDMAYAGKLFGVFQRLHRIEDYEGTGIGLALTKRVIERHGGWIAAEGAVGRGAVFTFALPKRTTPGPESTIA